MNGDKKLYIYSGLAIAGAVVAYMLITKKKTLSTDSSEGSGTPDAETTVAVTTTGDVVDQTQVIIPSTLTEILKKNSSDATLALINKPIYTKLDEVKVRNSNFVNNGIVNNVMSTITNRGTNIGNVIQILEDKGKLKNSDGRIYKWFKIKPSQIALDDMNRNKGVFTPNFLPAYNREIFVREDTVKLEK